MTMTVIRRERVRPELLFAASVCRRSTTSGQTRSTMAAAALLGGAHRQELRAAAADRAMLVSFEALLYESNRS
jgi:hypothetical protein